MTHNDPTDGHAGFSFTKLDASGNPLAIQNGTWSDSGSEAAGTRWSCVRDNVTGLIWEVKTDDSGLRDMNWTYSWYDSSSPDGVPGTEDGGTCNTSGRCDTEKYVEDVNAQVLCGFDDWRMPTPKELVGIAQLGGGYPAIDTNFFPNNWSTFPAYFWSSSPYAYLLDSAWIFQSFSGAIHGSDKENDYYVRLVRAEQPIPTFVNNGDATISDINTGLMWAQCSAGQTGVDCGSGSAHAMAWQDALTYAEEATLAGFSDWRLPNPKELQSLVDYSSDNPAIDEHMFPRTPLDPFWSSSPDGQYPSPHAHGWFVGFRNGFVDRLDRGQDLNVRLVRAGQSLEPTPLRLELEKSAAVQATLTVDVSEDTHHCDPGCSSLAIEPIPAGTELTIQAETSDDLVLWSWGNLPCSSASTQCTFVLASDTSAYVAFQVGEEHNADVPISPEGTVVTDPATGVEVQVPAGAVTTNTNITVNVKTNDYGETSYEITDLDPEAWAPGGHEIVISKNPTGSAQREHQRSTDDQVQLALPNDGMGFFAEIESAAYDSPNREDRFHPVATVSNRTVWDTCIFRTDPEYRAPLNDCSYQYAAVAVAACADSDADSPEAVCPAERQPIILVNGYQARDGFKDEESLYDVVHEYWEDLPQILYEAGYAPYIFRWNTAQRFEDAAALLRSAVAEVRTRHDKPPLIVAHSFGGVMARVYAQGLDSSDNAAQVGKDEILGIVTIGAPHSGISQDGKILVDDVEETVPVGPDPDGQAIVANSDWLLSLCRQLSCFQAGLEKWYFWPRIKLVGPNPESEYNFMDDYGLTANPGRVIYDLSNPPGSNQHRVNVPLYALLSMETKDVYVKSTEDELTRGDGLISWQGQRVHPSLSCFDDSCADYPISDSDIYQDYVFAEEPVEWVLGNLFESNANFYPGQRVAWDSSSGYSHSAAFGGTTSTLHAQVVIQTWMTETDPPSHDTLIAIYEILDRLTAATNYSWLTGDWSTCTGACGTNQGTQTRDVQCVDGNETPVEEDNCEEPKPETTQACTVCVEEDLIAGRYLPIGEDGGIIRDTVNGLEWQRCAVGQTWDPEAETCSGSASKHNGYEATALTAPGGFRAPTISELRTLVYCSSGQPALFGMPYTFQSCAGDYDRPTIVVEAFPDTPFEKFWSSTTGHYIHYFAMTVNFSYGKVDSWEKEESYMHVRLVRAGQ